MRIFADTDFWIKMQIFLDVDAGAAFTQKMQVWMLKIVNADTNANVLDEGGYLQM